MTLSKKLHRMIFQQKESTQKMVKSKEEMKKNRIIIENMTGNFEKNVSNIDKIIQRITPNYLSIYIKKKDLRAEICQVL